MKSLGPINTTLAAGVPINNVLSGEVFEILEDDAMVTVYCTVPAASANTCTIEFSIGSQIIIANAVVPIEAAAGTGPNMQQQAMAVAPGLAGERLRLRAVDSAGAVLKTMLLIDDD